MLTDGRKESPNAQLVKEREEVQDEAFVRDNPQNGDNPCP